MFNINCFRVSNIIWVIVFETHDFPAYRRLISQFPSTLQIIIMWSLFFGKIIKQFIRPTPTPISSELFWLFRLRLFFFVSFLLGDFSFFFVSGMGSFDYRVIFRWFLINLIKIYQFLFVQIRIRAFDEVLSGFFLLFFMMLVISSYDFRVLTLFNFYTFTIKLDTILLLRISFWWGKLVLVLFYYFLALFIHLLHFLYLLFRKI